jgi:hypothetical protein
MGILKKATCTVDVVLAQTALANIGRMLLSTEGGEKLREGKGREHPILPELAGKWRNLK